MRIQDAFVEFDPLEGAMPRSHASLFGAIAERARRLTRGRSRAQIDRLLLAVQRRVLRGHYRAAELTMSEGFPGIAVPQPAKYLEIQLETEFRIRNRNSNPRNPNSVNRMELARIESRKVQFAILALAQIGIAHRAYRNPFPNRPMDFDAIQARGREWEKEVAEGAELAVEKAERWTTALREELTRIEAKRAQAHKGGKTRQSVYDVLRVPALKIFHDEFYEGPETLDEAADAIWPRIEHLNGVGPRASRILKTKDPWNRLVRWFIKDMQRKGLDREPRRRRR